jgi:hypothetical protein
VEQGISPNVVPRSWCTSDSYERNETREALLIVETGNDVTRFDYLRALSVHFRDQLRSAFEDGTRDCCKKNFNCQMSVTVGK